MLPEDNNEESWNDDNNYQQSKTRRPKRTVEQIHEEKKQAYYKSLTKIKNNDKKRKDRKTFLLGESATILIEKDPNNKEPLIEVLNTYLTRDKDRELFGLPPINKDKKAE